MNAPLPAGQIDTRPTYGVLTLDERGWLLSDVAPHVAIRLKAIFPAIPKWQTSPFRFPLDPGATADLAWFESRYHCAMSPGDRRALRRGLEFHEALAAEIGRIKADDYAPPSFAGLRDGQTVRPHQAQAAAILHRVSGLLVGDDTGEGKTYTAGACLLLPGALPAWVVCQPHLKAQWKEKLESFTTLACHTVKGTKPYSLPPCDVRIIGYTQLNGWVDVLSALGVGLVAFDEMQELRTGLTAQKGQAADRLATSARLRLGLTATPIYNYGDEIWQVIRFLRPELLGSHGDFLREWCSTLRNGKSRVVNPSALGSYLRAENALVRKTKDRASAPNVEMIPISHDRATLWDVEAVARELAQTATRGSFEERGEAARQLDLRVRQATGIAKAPFVAAFVRMLVEQGEPVILWGWHREVYDIWMRELRDLHPAMFTGSETTTRKEREKQRFLDGETDVMLMSLRAGAGVDGLQARCSVGVFGELDWSPGIHHQCIGRLDREGQRAWPDPVNAYYLVTDDGSDPPMVDVLGLKASQAAQIVDPSLGVQRVASDGSHLRRLIERYLHGGAA